MSNSKSIKNLVPYLIAVLFLLVIAFMYFSPVLSGKSISMHDQDMSTAVAKELVDYHKATGEYSWWTNSVFAGMPANMIYGKYPNSLSSNLGTIIYNLLPIPVNVIFLLMLGFFIFMTSMRNKVWVSVIASVAYAFGTYNLLYTEAGHLSKILALAFAPPILGGMALIFRQKYWLGGFVTALFLSLEIYANHLQITYYFIFILFAYWLYESIKLFKNQEKAIFLKVSGVLVVAVLIGIGSHTMRLWNNYVYSQESTRGVSELTQSTVGTSGLDRDYAFAWSYGIDETFNLIIPDLMGGGSIGSLSTNSETYKTLVSNGVDANMAEQFVNRLPLYFGKQSFTSGPAYSGILIVFLYILGFFLIKGNFKWINLALTLFFIILAWGSNFSGFNYLIFDHLPGYNKFRAVTMTLVIVHFLLVWGSAQTLMVLLKKELDWQSLKKPLMYSAAGIVGLMLVGYLSVDFVGPRDAEFRAGIAQSTSQDFANKIGFALQKDRKVMAQNDIMRGLGLILVLIVAVLLFAQVKLKEKTFHYALFLLIAFDLIGVGKRYFNNDDFQDKKIVANPFQATPADQEILNDKDPNFKVLNLTTSFSSDARDSYFHKSIGGYHGAKLKKTQELFDNQLTEEDGSLNMRVVDMLNTKYLIVNTEEGLKAERNFDALGNIWFVDGLKVVKNADEELAALGSFDPKTTAVTQQNQGVDAAQFSHDSTDVAKLVSYAPNKLVYETQSQNPQYGVFSEIYYRGNRDWKSYIDGVETPHQKVNYLLRGMEIPAGKHEIIFEFKPKAVEKGKIGDLIASLGLIVMGLGAVYFNVKGKE